MTLTTYFNAAPNEVVIVNKALLEDRQRQRILAAIGIVGEQPPLVDEETLMRYFEYRVENLSLPFTAHYPEPSTPLENDQFECTVLELLDPSKFVGDPFDGIFCKTRKAGFEVNLPLIELEIAHDDSNFQIIEDYWYWFWNWR